MSPRGRATSAPRGTLGAPAVQEQQERHWEGITVGWSMVIAALPAWNLISITACEPRAGRTLHGPRLGMEQESRAVGAVPGQAGGGARLWEGKIQTEGVDCPSSIPIPIQEDGGSDVLETQLLPMLDVGQKGWRPHPGHPASNSLGAGGTFLGHLYF